MLDEGFDGRLECARQIVVLKFLRHRDQSRKIHDPPIQGCRSE